MITCSEGYVTLWVNSSHYKPPSCQVWWSQMLCKGRNFVFRLSRNLAWLRCQRVMWHYRCVSFVIIDYPTKFEPFWREDIKVSICHVTSRDHMVRGSSDIIEWVIVIISHCPVKSAGHRLCGIGDIQLLICHVTPREHVVRGLGDIMGEFPSS